MLEPGPINRVRVAQMLVLRDFDDVRVNDPERVQAQGNQRGLRNHQSTHCLQISQEREILEVWVVRPDVERTRDLPDAVENIESVRVHGFVHRSQGRVEVNVLKALEGHVPDVDVALDFVAASESLEVARVYDPVALADLDALAVYGDLIVRTGQDAGVGVDKGVFWTLSYALGAVRVFALCFPRTSFFVVPRHVF